MGSFARVITALRGTMSSRTTPIGVSALFDHASSAAPSSERVLRAALSGGAFDVIASAPIPKFQAASRLLVLHAGMPRAAARIAHHARACGLLPLLVDALASAPRNSFLVASTHAATELVAFTRRAGVRGIAAVGGPALLCLGKAVAARTDGTAAIDSLPFPEYAQVRTRAASEGSAALPMVLMPALSWDGCEAHSSLRLLPRVSPLPLPAALLPSTAMAAVYVHEFIADADASVDAQRLGYTSLVMRVMDAIIYCSHDRVNRDDCGSMLAAAAALLVATNSATLPAAAHALASIASYKLSRVMDDLDARGPAAGITEALCTRFQLSTDAVYTDVHGDVLQYAAGHALEAAEEAGGEDHDWWRQAAQSRGAIASSIRSRGTDAFPVDLLDSIQTLTSAALAHGSFHARLALIVYVQAVVLTLCARASPQVLQLVTNVEKTQLEDVLASAADVLPAVRSLSRVAEASPLAALRLSPPEVQTACTHVLAAHDMEAGTLCGATYPGDAFELTRADVTAILARAEAQASQRL